jgi:hypothetical protein
MSYFTKEKTFFSGLRTVEEIKSHYKSLARKYHPDLGGDTATMQAVNSEYLAALEACNGQTSTNEETGKEHEYKYNATTEQAIIDKIAELFAAGMPESVRVYIIGLWVWILGTTREDKETIGKLKAAKCSWHAKRGCWYFRPYVAKHRGRGSKYGLGALAARYGCSEVKSEKRKTVSA